MNNQFPVRIFSGNFIIIFFFYFTVCKLKKDWWKNFSIFVLVLTVVIVPGR